MTKQTTTVVIGSLKVNGCKSYANSGDSVHSHRPPWTNDIVYKQGYSELGRRKKDQQASLSSINR